jgi:hypothetical protein
MAALRRATRVRPGVRPVNAIGVRRSSAQPPARKQPIFARGHCWHVSCSLDGATYRKCLPSNPPLPAISPERRRPASKFVRPAIATRRTTVNSRITNLVAAAAIGVAGLSSIATAEQYMTPVKEHELLAKEVGVWDADVKIWEKPDAEPMTSKGVEKNEMLGKMWLVSKFEGEAMGQKFTGHSALGYDPKEKQYIGGWIDSMSPFMTEMEGKYDESTKTLTMEAEGTDCMTGEECEMKMVTKWTDENSKTFEIHRQGEDGEMWKTMEIKYTRQK